VNDSNMDQSHTTGLMKGESYNKAITKQFTKSILILLLILPSDLILHNLLAHFFLYICRHHSIFFYTILYCYFLSVLFYYFHFQPAS